MAEAKAKSKKAKAAKVPVKKKGAKVPASRTYIFLIIPWILMAVWKQLRQINMK